MNFYFIKYTLQIYSPLPSNETAQQNPNTGQNCTTKSQHWAKPHNQITTLGKTSQRNHNTGQNCTTKSQHWAKLHNEITAKCRCSEAVVRRRSVKNVFLEISQNSKENACARYSFLIKL